MDAWHWIPDQVRDDKLCARDDNLGGSLRALALSLRALALSLRALALSLRATTRNPGVAWHWIPDVETPDPGSSPGHALIRGRDDKCRVRDDKRRVRDDRGISACFKVVMVSIPFKDSKRSSLRAVSLARGHAQRVARGLSSRTAEPPDWRTSSILSGTTLSRFENHDLKAANR